MKKLLPVIVVVFVVGGGTFYGGMKYAASKASAMVRGGGQGRSQQFSGMGGGRGMRMNSGFSSGEILSKDEKSITIKMRDGGSKIIFFGSATEFIKTVPGSLQDLTIGKQITITGNQNADGSISAQSIQVRPAPQATVAPSDAQNVPAEALHGTMNEKDFTITGTNFAFSPSTLTVKKGEQVKITFKNAEGFHDFRIDAFNVATARIGSGKDEVVTFTASKSGTFEYYCSVGSHRMMGMKGSLIVE